MLVSDITYEGDASEAREHQIRSIICNLGFELIAVLGLFATRRIINFDMQQFWGMTHVSASIAWEILKLRKVWPHCFHEYCL